MIGKSLDLWRFGNLTLGTVKVLPIFLLLAGIFVFCNAAFSQEILTPESKQRPELVELSEYLDGLIQKGFAHRDQITSGQMVITNQLKSGGGNSVERTITLAFDEQRSRVDRHNVYSPKISSDDAGGIGCYKSDSRLLFSYSNHFAKLEGQEVDPSRTQITFYDEIQLAKNELTKFWAEDFGFAPQYIGYFFRSRFPTKDILEKEKTGLLNLAGNMDFLSHESISVRWSGINEDSSTIAELTAGLKGFSYAVTVTKDEYKGTPCKKITFESKSSYGDDDGSSLTSLWIAEGQGGALRKHYHRSQGRVDYEESLEVDVALDKDSNIWFPSAWQYVRKNDDQLRSSQNVTIKDVTLNKPIPDEIFEMKNIKILPAGVNVRWLAEMVPPPYEEKLVWDGNDIISQSMWKARESEAKKAASEKQADEK